MLSEVSRPHRPTWLRLLIMLQSRCREAADGLDSHDRAAGAKLNNVTGLEGLITHSLVSPATESRKCESVSRSDLTLVAKAGGFRDGREPQLRLGDIVQLNSGSPRMMVVDALNTGITTAWRDVAGKAQEMDLPAVCVHRVSPLG